MNDINIEIQTAFQATQLILVFLTVLFGIRYPQIQKELHEKIPPGPEAKKNLRKILNQSLIEKCFPLILINFVALILFAPLFWGVVTTSNFDLLNFDFARTSFVFITSLIFLLFVWTLVLAMKLLKQKNKIKL